MFCSLKGKIAALVASGLTFATIGFALYLTFPLILQDQIEKRLVIKEGSESYRMWKDVPVPIYLHIYLFNVTNPQDFYNLERPELEELGPYTFREEREKVNITWHKNGTVSYRQIKRWYFQPDKTVGSLSDRIVTLNVPMVAAVKSVEKMNQSMISYAMQIILDESNETWLVDKTVNELLFEGYNDTLINLAKDFINLPYDKFGWFYNRNNSDDGKFSVYTGDGDIESLDEVDTWNYLKSVTAFDPPCNDINGSAGDMWPPGLTHRSKPTIFITDICRSLSFTFLEEVDTKGINTYRYWSDDTQLDNGKCNPDNKCFCSDDVCLPAGAVDVSVCKFDAPAVVSYPHFLFADPIYSQGVIGMKPNPDKHKMYFSIIPEMGVPLDVAARMQINVIFEKIDDVMQFQNITRRTYFPVLWFSETATAESDIINQLKLPLVTLPLISKIVSFILVAIGCFLVFAAFGLAILYALGKIEDTPRSLSSSSLVEDKSERPKKEKEPSYGAVKTGSSSQGDKK